MTNENKQTVIDAIKETGYDFSVQELEPIGGKMRIENGMIIREEIVNFQARIRTETKIPE